MNRWIVILALLLGGSILPAQENIRPATSGVRFTTVDVLIDTSGKPLAAYQIEFIADTTRVKLVGVEGGQHPAFAKPPYYDPAALSKNRVILAAYSTGADLPSTQTRIARLHVQIEGSPEFESQGRLIVASASDGNAIDAKVQLKQEGEVP